MSRIESGSVKLDEKQVHMPDLLHDLRTMIQGLINSKQQKAYSVDYLMPDMNGIETIRRIRRVIGEDAAIISADVQCKRMDEILSHDIQTGTDQLTNKGYDIEFNHVGFTYNDREAVL